MLETIMNLYIGEVVVASYVPETEIITFAAQVSKTALVEVYLSISNAFTAASHRYAILELFWPSWLLLIVQVKM